MWARGGCGFGTRRGPAAARRGRRLVGLAGRSEARASGLGWGTGERRLAWLGAESSNWWRSADIFALLTASLSMTHGRAQGIARHHACGSVSGRMIVAPYVPFEVRRCETTCNVQGCDSLFVEVWGDIQVRKYHSHAHLAGAMHRSSSFLRTGTIYGGPDTSYELSFEPHQQGLQPWRGLF